MKSCSSCLSPTFCLSLPPTWYLFYFLDLCIKYAHLISPQKWMFCWKTMGTNQTEPRAHKTESVLPHNSRYIISYICIYIYKIHTHAYPHCISFYLRALFLPLTSTGCSICVFPRFFWFGPFSFFLWLRAFLLSRSLMHVNEFNWIISCHFAGLLSHVKIVISATKNSPWSSK